MCETIREPGLSKESKLSKTMTSLVERMRRGDGTVTRSPGGYWRCEWSSLLSWGSSTVNALEARGVIEWCEWVTRSGGSKFPVKAKLKEAA